MLETLKNAWKMADLRAKLLYTGMILLLFRIGAAIPVPFLKPDILKTYISGDNNWLGYIDLLSGGAFSNSTLFALGISPYITASIVIQLLAVAIPALEQLAKEGEEGRKILVQSNYPGIGARSGTAAVGGILLPDAQLRRSHLYRGPRNVLLRCCHHHFLPGWLHAGYVDG